MPDERPLERCFSCDDPTGHAGAGDGSLYDELGLGPYCQDCWDKQQAGFIANDGTADDLRRQLAEAKERYADIERAVWQGETGRADHEGLCDEIRRMVRVLQPHDPAPIDEQLAEAQRYVADHPEAADWIPVIVPAKDYAKLAEANAAREKAEAALDEKETPHAD